MQASTDAAKLLAHCIQHLNLTNILLNGYPLMIANTCDHITSDHCTEYAMSFQVNTVSQMKTGMQFMNYWHDIHLISC